MILRYVEIIYLYIYINYIFVFVFVQVKFLRDSEHSN